MGHQTVEYVYQDADSELPIPVKKQVWNGKGFVATTLIRTKGVPAVSQEDWLCSVAGPRGIWARGRFWDRSLAGNFTVMDETLAVWYQLKWNTQ